MNISRLDKMKQKSMQFINKQEWLDAKKQLEKQCKKFPKDFDSWYLLGAVSGQVNDIAAAEKYCKKALSIQPEHAGALFNWGMALSKLGKLDEAAMAYEKSLSINPENPSALYSLGNVYKDLSLHKKAIEYLKRSLEYAPDKAEALFSLGTIYVELENKDQAIKYLQRSIDADPSTKIKAEYFLSSLTERKSANEHVKVLHDKHSDYFDEHLTKALGYKIPKILYDTYMLFVDNKAKDLDILDLGCGTGLCGIEFYNISKKLIGVDISQGMIEKARLTGKYNELITDDINNYLANLNSKFDLIISADVFIYIGAIDKIITECSRLLKDKGIMIFSVESIEGSDYRLRTSGRYAHSEKYIEDLAVNANMSIKVSESTVIRKEHGVDINGTVFILQKE